MPGSRYQDTMTVNNGAAPPKVRRALAMPSAFNFMKPAAKPTSSKWSTAKESPTTTATTKTTRREQPNGWMRSSDLVTTEEKEAYHAARAAKSAATKPQTTETQKHEERKQEPTKAKASLSNVDELEKALEDIMNM